MRDLESFSLCFQIPSKLKPLTLAPYFFKNLEVPSSLFDLQWWTLMKEKNGEEGDEERPQIEKKMKRNEGNASLLAEIQREERESLHLFNFCGPKLKYKTHGSHKHGSNLHKVLIMQVHLYLGTQ